MTLMTKKMRRRKSKKKKRRMKKSQIISQIKIIMKKIMTMNLNNKRKNKINRDKIMKKM